MKSRVDFQTTGTETLKAMLALQSHVDTSGLDRVLLDLIKVRASQLNGCAYCIDMHSLDARAHGESEQRLYALDAWAETPFYNDRERAALAWTEAVTLLRETHVSDQDYAAASAQFDEPTLIKLTLAVVAINGWNRLCVAFRALPGSYRPKGDH